jgi:hypothetical protein
VLIEKPGIPGLSSGLKLTQRIYQAALRQVGNRNRTKTYFMLLAISSLFDQLPYLSENLSCLYYGFELINARLVFVASYSDLVSDLAESFGV